jgi:hypothetical protein
VQGGKNGFGQKLSFLTTSTTGEKIRQRKRPFPSSSAGYPHDDEIRHKKLMAYEKSLIYYATYRALASSFVFQMRHYQEYNLITLFVFLKDHTK